MEKSAICGAEDKRDSISLFFGKWNEEKEKEKEEANWTDAITKWNGVQTDRQTDRRIEGHFFGRKSIAVPGKKGENWRERSSREKMNCPIISGYEFEMVKLANLEEEKKKVYLPKVLNNLA